MSGGCETVEVGVLVRHGVRRESRAAGLDVDEGSNVGSVWRLQEEGSRSAAGEEIGRRQAVRVLGGLQAVCGPGRRDPGSRVLYPPPLQ